MSLRLNQPLSCGPLTKWFDSLPKLFKNITYQRQLRWYEKHRESLERGLYEPFWRTEDVASWGTKEKLPHFCDRYRVVHLLSANEVFKYLEISRDPNIKNCYEQYALPLEDTLKIALELEVAHPVYPGTKIPIVQTLDFLCIYKDGSKNGIAVKDSRELDKYRCREKIGIQEGFCRINEMGFELAESTDLKTEKYQNLDRLRRHRVLAPLMEEAFRSWLSNFLGTLSDLPHERLTVILEQSAELTGLPFQQAAHFIHYAIWTGVLDIDWNVPFLLYKPASEIGIVPNAA